MTTGDGHGSEAVIDGTGFRGSGTDSVSDSSSDSGSGSSEAIDGPPAATARNGHANTREVAVAVEGVTKRFGSGKTAITAVDNVSFDIEAGSIVGLLGPNGAGKTTLIKSVLGMVLPDEGRVRICGFDVQDQPRAAYAHVDAMLEGARNDYWRLTVRENLRYFATVGGVDPDSVAARHERLLDRLDLTEKADVAVRKLSRGMKQKVSLASVLAGGADVVFLDEPTLGLDVESSRTLQRELRRLAEEEGLTVVLSSHDMDVVETVCDRVLIMSNGRIIADDSVDELLRGDGRHGVQLTSREFDADLLAGLRARFSLTVVERLERDRGTRIELTVDTDGLYALMAYLREHEITLDRVSTVEPDLEEVFVALTGDDGRAPLDTTGADE
jgi:ABC-2 type transport system ATP-binding protein